MTAHFERRTQVACLLFPLSLLYRTIVRFWHLLFDLGIRKPVRIPNVTVISVGNLRVGGAGKTPVVIHLVNQALARGEKVAVLTRGYGRTSTQPIHFDSEHLPPVEVSGDEPRLIARRCPGATVYVGSNRIESAREAAKKRTTVLFLDDGFQHRQLARDVDLLVDAGLGNGWLLPAGPLREPPSARRRATHIWGRDGRPGDIEALHAISGIRGPDGHFESPDFLKNSEVVLLVGVARPESVVQSVESLGARIHALHAHPDHHHFTPSEIEAAQRDAVGRLLVTTEKDAERLPEGIAWVLRLDVQVTRGALPPFTAKSS